MFFLCKALRYKLWPKNSPAPFEATFIDLSQRNPSLIAYVHLFDDRLADLRRFSGPRHEPILATGPLSYTNTQSAESNAREKRPTARQLGLHLRACRWRLQFHESKARLAG
jgi:hypothetical protein